MSSRQVVDKISWGKVNQPIADLFRKPLANFEKLGEKAKTRNRQSQITKGDLPFQIVEDKNDWLLVKLADSTFGWLPKKYVKILKTKNYWDKIKLAQAGKTTPLPYCEEAKITKIIAKYEGLPYLWGGNSGQGLDCSSFTQRFFWEAFGILLPRNSRRQKKCGISVYSCDICPLDILFFSHKKTKRHHTGVYFKNKVFHFCLDKLGLSSECLLDMKKRYRHLASRRIIKFKNA